ncbi:putative nicotinate-nucleotide adenylyltransferase [Paenibacillus montaniterrae]|uniref:Probable nicotinate-nucleotide adenylyltransferase n=1 Tax=Paenibacillus montaniterrae TaxID=429341 RepID=A0A920CZ97_9BACL|nr:nicotinate-nucleotide adenylyltransferase [Paenibacillus montaniterrae]GIP16794.1 putative nicotinate-nucleotide adenylyltransferase [Paenibacillus montaniterrae]
MSRIGIMGGTFDPIHIGHLIAAVSAMEAAELDEVWFIPAATPPLKPNAPIADEQHRLEMVKLATRHEPRFRVLDIELKRGGTSYSIDTIASLMEQHEGCDFHYIVGSDRIHDLPQWHRAEELRQRIGFIGLNRPSAPLQPELLPQAWRSSVAIITAPQIEISSTELRKRAAQGKSLRYFVADEVEQYIRRYHLYE